MHIYLWPVQRCSHGSGSMQGSQRSRASAAAGELYEDRTKKMKTSRPPSPSFSNAAHTRAFDRIYICDFFYHLADNFITDCIHAKNTNELKNAKAPFVEFVVAEGRKHIDYGKDYEEREMNQDARDRYVTVTGRPWSYFHELIVSCSLDASKSVFSLNLRSIFAQEEAVQERGNGYVYATLQGLKMAAIANNERVQKEFDPRPMQIHVVVESPYIETTVRYLQSRENYPPLNFFKKWGPTMAPSMKMKLVKDPSTKVFRWYVETEDCDVDAMQQYNEKLSSRPGVVDLIPFDSRKALFCTETLIGSRICKDISAMIFYFVASQEATTTWMDMTLWSALSQAVFTRLVCTLISEPKKRRSIPRGMGASTPSQKDYTMRIKVEMQKRMAFAWDQLKEGVLAELVALVGGEMLRQGDLAISAIEVTEVDAFTGLEEKASHDMLLYGSRGLQIDTAQRLPCSSPAVAETLCERCGGLRRFFTP